MPSTASYFDSLDLPVATPPETVIFGQSEPMKLVRQQVKKFARAKVPVLIEGESGTGKQTLAQFIHCGSPWRDGLFFKMYCPVISRTLFEGEPFGHARGVCAISDDTDWGRAAGAHKGTLFLDEIAEVDFPSQGKLLEALRDGQLWRIGAWENQRVDVRLICATSHRLEQEVEAGRFRRDLLYRINVANLRVPALRERSDDIPGLAEYFLATYNEQYRCKAPVLSTDLLKILKNYDWPGIFVSWRTL